MAGRFKVIDIFNITGRGPVIIGDIVEGCVRVGEGLRLPLTLARIKGVETTTRGNIGLLLYAQELEVSNLDGAELDVTPIPGHTNFFDAADRLRKLLRHMGRSDNLVWVSPSQIIRFPYRVYIFRPTSDFPALSAFESAATTCAAVRVGAVGSIESATFATIWPIHTLGDGEHMFIHNGVKINAPEENPRVTVVTSRLRWWLITRSYEQWRKRRGLGAVAPGSTNA